MEFSGTAPHRLSDKMIEEGITKQMVTDYLEENIQPKGKLMLRFKPTGTGGGAYAPTVYTTGPQHTIVLPENMAVDANLMLESSTDLINWTPAELGWYSPATERRFFRFAGDQGWYCQFKQLISRIRSTLSTIP